MIHRSRRTFLSALSALPAMRGLARESLTVRLDDGMLRVSAPSFHFIEGKTLQRLHDGAGLLFSLQLSLSTDQFRTILHRSIDRFVISFDLWEEKYAVLPPTGRRPGASHLSRDAAERWLFDHAGMPASTLSPNTSHWIRADLRADDPRDNPGFLLDPTVTLTRLVEWFGRAQRGDAQRWSLEQGPFLISGLKR